MRHDTAIDYRARITRVLRHIQHAVGSGEQRGLTAPALAELAHFSPFHFSRIFTGMVGESVGEHVRRLRLEKAAGELVRTDRQVLSIALGCGYGTHEAFTRAFSAHFGLAPTEFRRKAGDPIEFPTAPSCVHFGTDDAINTFIPLLKESPMLDVEIKQVPARRLAGMRHIGAYNQVGGAYGRLFAWAGPRGFVGPKTEVVGVYYDDPSETSVDKLRADVCITAPDGFDGDTPAGVTIVELEAGQCAVGTYQGPYERLDEAYQWFFGSWLPQSGRLPADRPTFEICRNTPEDTPPEKLITEIYIPLQTAAQPTR